MQSILTYNNFLIDNMTALIIVNWNEIREDSHYNNSRDLDQYITEKEERRKPVSSMPSQFHNFEGKLSGMSER